jgi:two-component system KDP operon response regulator KdpE
MVDDDAGIRRVVSRALAGAGFDVVAVPDRVGALAALAQRRFGLVLLDVNLPDSNGLDLCAEVRGAYDVPIVMLTVVVDESDIVRALESGADDYVRKPFSTRELVARIQSVMRRARRDETAADASLRAGTLELDAASYRATLHGERLPLTPTEYRLLAQLVQNAGRVLTHDQLLTFVWGAGYEGEHHMLHVTMSRLRGKLGRHADAGTIRTMPGIGYEFVAAG